MHHSVKLVTNYTITGIKNYNRGLDAASGIIYNCSDIKQQWCNCSIMTVV
jgi:hypothetical protein